VVRSRSPATMTRAGMTASSRSEIMFMARA
jgi:hypothetical protein